MSNCSGSNTTRGATWSTKQGEGVVQREIPQSLDDAGGDRSTQKLTGRKGFVLTRGPAGCRLTGHHLDLPGGTRLCNKTIWNKHGAVLKLVWHKSPL